MCDGAGENKNRGTGQGSVPPGGADVHHTRLFLDDWSRRKKKLRHTGAGTRPPRAGLGMGLKVGTATSSLSCITSNLFAIYAASNTIYHFTNSYGIFDVETLKLYSLEAHRAIVTRREHG